METGVPLEIRNELVTEAMNLLAEVSDVLLKFGVSLIEESVWLHRGPCPGALALVLTIQWPMLKGVYYRHCHILARR